MIPSIQEIKNLQKLADTTLLKQERNLVTEVLYRSAKQKDSVGCEVDVHKDVADTLQAEVIQKGFHCKIEPNAHPNSVTLRITWGVAGDAIR
jgi:hypothetical protein